MEMIKKHVDTVVVLGGILSAVLWINHQLNDLKGEINALRNDVNMVKTVLILKGIMPEALAKVEQK